MTDQQEHVTVVTRNDNPLWKLTVELGMTAFAFYYVTHPDMFDRAKEWTANMARRGLNRLRIWDTRNEIRNLPETED